MKLKLILILAFFLLALPLSAFGALTDGLIIYYTFNNTDTAGIYSVNQLSKALNGTINGATTGASGLLGESYSFDGVNDNVQTTDPILVSLNTSGVTACFWVNRSNPTSNDAFIEKMT